MTEAFERLGTTLERRFWIAATGGTIATLIMLGVPSTVIPSPLFIRMRPTEPFNVAVWLASAPLTGLLMASYLSKGVQHVAPAAFPSAGHGSLDSIRSPEGDPASARPARASVGPPVTNFGGFACP